MVGGIRYERAHSEGSPSRFRMGERPGVDMGGVLKSTKSLIRVEARFGASRYSALDNAFVRHSKRAVASPLYTNIALLRAE